MFVAGVLVKKKYSSARFLGSIDRRYWPLRAKLACGELRAAVEVEAHHLGARRQQLRFVFFKHKTAYEMSVSDWSSDVCSSDLVSPEIDETIHVDLKLEDLRIDTYRSG